MVSSRWAPRSIQRPCVPPGGCRMPMWLPDTPPRTLRCVPVRSPGHYGVHRQPWACSSSTSCLSLVQMTAVSMPGLEDCWCRRQQRHGHRGQHIFASSSGRGQGVLQQLVSRSCQPLRQRRVDRRQLIGKDHRGQASAAQQHIAPAVVWGHGLTGLAKGSSRLHISGHSSGKACRGSAETVQASC